MPKAVELGLPVQPMQKEAGEKVVIEPVRLASPHELLGQPANRVRLAKPEHLGVPRPPSR